MIITALRTFTRFLIATGRCQTGLDVAIPSVAGWRLSALPPYLAAADVERVLSACGTTTAAGDIWVFVRAISTPWVNIRLRLKCWASRAAILNYHSFKTSGTRS